MDNSEKIEKLEWCVRAVLKAYDHNSGEPFAISEYWIEQAEAALALPNPKLKDAAPTQPSTPKTNV